MADLMTTREAADYLRVKERKIYDLVRSGRIPCTRVTGKWLFPRHLIDLWLVRQSEGPEASRAPARPPIVAGSHDPLLDWALRESGCELAMFTCGSAAGLERFADGRALAAGLHLMDEAGGDYNVATIRRAAGTHSVVAIEWAWRSQGLVVGPENPLAIEGIADLASRGARVAHRQAGSGSELLFRHLLAEAGLEPGALTLLPEPTKSETELGLAVLEGEADAGLAVEAAARQLRLGFVPLARERYDLVVARRDYFEPPFQKLMEFARSTIFAQRATSLGGYDISSLGRIAWNAP